MVVKLSQNVQVTDFGGLTTAKLSLDTLVKEEPSTKEPEPEKNSQLSQFIKN